MRYVLTQPNGHVRQFYTLSCAKLYQLSHGGVITIEELIAA